MNIVTVNINDVDYNLKGEENDEYLLKVADYVDKKMRTILESNPRLSVTAAAVLTALMLDDLFKCEASYKGLNNDIEGSKAKNRESMESKLLHLRNWYLKYREKPRTFTKIKNNKDNENLKAKEEEVSSLKQEVQSLKEELEKNKSDFKAYKAENKELRFQLQTARYKIIDLQNKLVENQINLVKLKDE